MLRLAPFGLILTALCVLAPGCAEGPMKTDPKVLAQLREQLVLAEEPDGAVTTLDWREGLEESSEEQDESDDSVVLVGTVGGMPNPWGDTEPAFPWRDGEATFFLVDPSTAAEFAAHEEEVGGSHDDCPFCAREAVQKANAIAAVRFLDEAGKPTKVDARELFGLKAGDMVVVRGQASLLGEDLLVLDADALHVRR